MKKVVLLTGASSGIGAATAQALAAAGYRVFGGARRPETVTAPENVELLELDVCKPEQVSRAVEDVLSRCGRIDVLINNAGVSLAGPVEATSDAEALALFDTNLFGALRMTRAVLPAMRQQSSGVIINVSSVLGFLPAPFMGLYASSKHALEGLSESLDHEVRGFGIRVVLVQPGFTSTSLDANATLTRKPVPAYESAFQSSLTAVQRQIAEGAAPSSVATEILAAIAGSHRLRRPVGSGAHMLSVLRRFAPSPLLDRGIRKTFAMQS